MAITPELFEQMLKAMDSDGDGQIDKDEFLKAYTEFSVKEGKKLSNTEKEKIWVKVDTDKSGDVSKDELAAFFGFKIVNGHVVSHQSDEMDDDEKILAALQMAASLDITEPAAAAAKPVEPPKKVERVKAINLKTAEDGLERKLLEEAALGNIKLLNSVVDEMVEKKVDIRIEDAEQGQLAIHKIARVVKSTNAEEMVRLGRKLLDAGGKSGADINYPDKAGKTPLHLACDSGLTEFARMLIDRGADPCIQTDNGWTVLHSAVQSRSVELVASVLDNPRIAPKKKDLIKMTDKQGRTALHIASFRSEEEHMVKLLLDHGADPKAGDKSGNTAGKLATKTGRRKSRELLDAFS